VVVGQQISLTGAEFNLPTGVTVSSRSWTVQGSPVNNYAVSNSSGAVTAFASSGTTAQAFYWIAAGTNTVTYAATLSNSATVSATATFTVTSPSLLSYTSATSGVSCCSSGLGFGISWTIEINTGTNEAGTVGFLQLVTPDHVATLNNSSTQTLSSSSPVLDNPPGAIIVSAQTSWPASQDGTLSSSDGPQSTLVSSDVHLSVSDAFKTYVAYMPGGTNSIWVVLGALTWNYSAAASKDGSGTWTLDSGSTYSANPSGSGSTTLPTWTNFVTNLSYH
jgi:hypothetical protein